MTIELEAWLIDTGDVGIQKLHDKGAGFLVPIEWSARQTKELPGFPHDAMAALLDVEGSIRWAFVSKATILLDVKSRQPV